MKDLSTHTETKRLVLITGAAGDIGSALAEALAHDYTLVGLDRTDKGASIPIIRVDLTSDESVAGAFAELRKRYGEHIASVIHLAAYFDFTGEDNPLYDQVNVAGTRRLLKALQSFEVEQLVYSGTMLVSTRPRKRCSRCCARSATVISRPAARPRNPRRMCPRSRSKRAWCGGWSPTQLSAARACPTFGSRQPMGGWC